MTAAPTQKNPTDQWDVLPPCERVAAVPAVGARLNNALALRPATQADVQKAAEGEPEQTGKDGSQNANHMRG